MVVHHDWPLKVVKSSVMSHFNDMSLEFNCCCHGDWVFLVGVFFVCRVHDWQARARVQGPERKSSRTETDPQQNPWWNQWQSPFPADNQVRTFSCTHSHTFNNKKTHLPFFSICVMTFVSFRQSLLAHLPWQSFFLKYLFNI